MQISNKIVKGFRIINLKSNQYFNLTIAIEYRRKREL